MFYFFSTSPPPVQFFFAECPSLELRARAQSLPRAAPQQYCLQFDSKTSYSMMITKVVPGNARSLACSFPYTPPPWLRSTASGSSLVAHAKRYPTTAHCTDVRQATGRPTVAPLLACARACFLHTVKNMQWACTPPCLPATDYGHHPLTHSTLPLADAFSFWGFIPV